METSKKVDFTSGPMGKNIVAYAIPVLLTTIISSLFGTADMMVVGKFVGDAAQAAVSATGMLRNLMITLVTGIATGVNVRMAQCIGAKDREGAKQVLHTGIAAAAVGGMAVGIGCILMTPYVLRWMQFPDSIREQALIYMCLYFLSLPVLMVYNSAASAFRAQGDSHRPMYFLVIAGVLNIVLNLIMVLVFHMGVAGVAIATVLSKSVALYLTIRCMNRDCELIHIDMHKLRIDVLELKKIARIGIPGAITSSAMSISSILIQSTINSMGDIVVAGSGAANNLGGYISSGMSAFSGSCVILCAQNLGAQRLDRVRQGYRQCLWYSVLYGLALGWLFVLTGPVMLQLFTNDPAVVREGMVRIWTKFPLYFFMGIMYCAQGAQQALGAAGVCSVISMLGTCVLRILWVLFVFPLHPTHAMIVFSFPAGWILTGIVQHIRFKWLLRHLEQKKEPIDV